MSRFRTTSAAMLIAVLVLAACTDAATTTTTTAPVATTQQATTQASTTTIEPAITTSSEPTTTTVVADGEVGSREALLEAMQPAIESSILRHGLDAEAVPIPEINGSDPVAALGQLLEFDLWVYSSAPVAGWSGILAVEGSPQWSEYNGAFALLGGRTANFDASKPFEILEIRLATDEEATSVPGDVVPNAEGETVLIFYRTRLDPHILSTPDSGEFDVEREGWTDQPRLALLLQTDLGWQFWWSEAR